MAGSAVRKVTLSLPEDLVCFADEVAHSQGSNRSRVVARAIAELRARRRDTLAREGYGFYACEAEEFAAASSAAVADPLTDARTSRCAT